MNHTDQAAKPEALAPVLADKCDECQKLTYGHSGEAKWCCYCGAKLTGSVARVPAPQATEQPVAAPADADAAFADDFEVWWEAEGKFCRAGGGDYEQTFPFQAGGGDYEKTFAFQAWRHLLGSNGYKYKGELYDEVWQSATGMGYANVTMALSALAEALAKPAVTVPDDFCCDSKPLERLLNATALMLETPCQDSATYWAACLAEVEQLLAPIPENGSHVEQQVKP